MNQDEDDTIVMPQPRRRWAFFPRSIVSDHENPSALLYREMARKIAELDDEARFYEERANPWLRRMLKQQGARGVLTFPERHPYVDYVTYDPKFGQSLADWLNLVLATADIAVVDCAAPTDIVRWVGELTRPHLHTFLHDPHGELESIPAIHDRISLYSGLCLGSGVDTTVSAESHQSVIRYGLVNPGPGSNGNAARHIERTAEDIVRQVISAVDNSLLRQRREKPSEQD